MHLNLFSLQAADSPKTQQDLKIADAALAGPRETDSVDGINRTNGTMFGRLRAITPDHDATSKGASIRLSRKPAYLYYSFGINSTAEFSASPISGTLGSNLKMEFKGPLNRQRTIGASISLQRKEGDYGFKTISQDWTKVGESYRLKYASIGEWLRYSEDQALNARLDYKASDLLNINWGGSFALKKSNTESPGIRYQMDPYRSEMDEAQNHTQSMGQVKLRQNSYESLSERVTAFLGSSYRNGNWEADLSLNFENADDRVDDYFVSEFVANDQLLEYDLGSNQEFRIQELVTNKVDYRFEDMNLRESQDDETTVTASLDAKHYGLFNDHGGYLKFGVKSQIDSEDRALEESLYDSFDGDLRLTDWGVGESLSNLIEDSWTGIPFGTASSDEMSHFDQNESFYELNLKDSRRRSDPNTYRSSKSVDSAFGMVDWRGRKARSLIGLRYEETSVNFVGNEVVTGEGGRYLGTNQTYGSRRYGNVFPNSHIQYNLSDVISLLASYSESIKRPRSGDMVPYRKTNIEDRELEEGNPNLGPTLAENWDLSADLSLSENSDLSLEVFSKSIDGYVFSSESIRVGGLYDGFVVERKENGGTASIKGLEASWDHELNTSFFPKGVSLKANYLAQQSEIVYPERPEDSLPLTNMPSERFRLAISYEKERLYAQISYNEESDALRSVSKSDANMRFTAPEQSLNASVNYQLSSTARLYVNLKDVTSEIDDYEYKASPERLTRIRYAPWSASVGVKWQM